MSEQDIVQVNTKSVDYKKIIVYVAYVLFIVKVFLDSSALIPWPDWADSVLVLVYLGLIFVKMMTQHYNRYWFFIFIVSILIVGYSSVTVNYFYLLSSFLFLMCLQDIDIRKLLMIGASTKLVMLSIHIVPFFIEYVLNNGYKYVIYRNGVSRYNFFIGHPNQFTAILVWFSFEVIYIFYHKLKIWALVGIWGLNFFFYQFTDSNTGIIVMSVVIFFLIFMVNDSHFFDATLRFLSKYLFGILSVIFPLLCIVYTRLSGVPLMLWNLLNNALTGRILYGAYAYDVKGFTLFGDSAYFPEKVHWREHWFDGIIFDNSYIMLFITYGIIYLIVLSMILILINDRLKDIERLMLIAYSLYGVMEAFVLNVFICFPLLLFGKVLYEWLDQMKKDKINEQSLITKRELEKGIIPLWQKK